MGTTSDNSLTITLSDAAPVRINKAAWPIVAAAKDDFQSDRSWRLFVRRHSDGRAIVYGSLTRGARPGRRGGVLLAKDADIPAAIMALGRQLDFDAELVERCIANLPATTLR